MVDLTPLIATAQRLITENGRSVTLVEFDTTLADAAKPWNGPADARATPNSTLVLDIVALEPDSNQQLGISTRVDDLIKRSEQIFIMSPGASVDLSPFQEVIDGARRWKIVGIEELKPGNSLALVFMGVER